MIKRHTIEVEHIRIESAKSFADVRAALERNVPQLDPTLLKALTDGNVERAHREKEQGPELFIVQVRDHGALLAIAGKACNALQYEIGNPVTATLMTRHRLSAALYAPIRVVLYDNDAGHIVFEYDHPSTNFGKFFGWRPWHYEGERMVKKLVHIEDGKGGSGASISSWRAELFVPFELLATLPNVPPKSGTIWNANFYRLDYDTNKATSWAWMPVGQSFHEYKKFGSIQFE